MSSPSELYISFVDAVNARDWQAAESVLAPTINVNGKDKTAQVLVQKVAGLSMVGPDLVSTIDYILPSPCGTKAFSRIVHRLTLVRDAMGAKATGAPVEFTEASFFFSEGGRISKVYTILDMDGMRSGATEVVRAAPAMTSSVPAPDGFDLLRSYRSYVACVQRGPTEAELSKYCHNPMVISNQKVTVKEFIGRLEDTKAILSGLQWDVVEEIVDQDRQQIATRVMLTSVPVRKFAGVEPNGKRAAFPEHVLYQFEGGKLKMMVQLLDLEGYRVSLGDREDMSQT